MAKLAASALPNTGWSGFVEHANSKQEFRDYCMLAAQHDLRVHTIVGDKLHEVIPIMAEMASRFPIGGRRWVIEHVGRTRAADLKTLKSLGLFVTTIPVYYLWKSGSRYLDEADDGDSIAPHRSLIDLDVPLAAGTDNIPYNPFFTLWAMCTRRERLSGHIIGANQTIPIEEGMRLLTRAGAWLSFEEETKGLLRPGYFADLTVLSTNPLQCSLDDLKDIRCKMTMVGGIVAFNEL